MTNFEKCFDRLMEHEGGYVNHPSDPGGETNWGVTKRVARKFGYRGSMKKLPKSTAMKIAKILYWDKVKADELPFAIAWQVFDSSYNHGKGNAIRFLQRALGVADDGKIGPVTLAATRRADIYDLTLEFNAERLEFFTRLKMFKTFGRGWSRRIVANLRYAAIDTE